MHLSSLEIRLHPRFPDLVPCVLFLGALAYLLRYLIILLFRNSSVSYVRHMISSIETLALG